MKFRWETEFKETEIGEIPRDWEIKKATEYVYFIRGIEPGSKSYKNFGKYRFIRVGNLSGEREDEVFIDIEVNNEKIANKNDILISFDGTVGIVRKGLEGIFSSGIRKIKIKQEKMQELNYEFLYWFFKSTLKYQIFGFSDEKTTLAHASDSIPYLKIFLPPLSEQSRIATVLSYFDDLIEVKKRQNEILEKTAIAIFKSWFIDFEPFRACPEQERGNYEFVYNEELGKEIPKGWEVKKIGEVADLKNGLSYKGSEKFNEQTHRSYIFITLNNIIEGGGFKTEYTWIKSERIKNQHLLKEGDIIFANTEQTKTGRLLGSPAFVIFPTQYSKSVGVFSHHLTKINPKDFRMKYFFYLLFRLYQQEFAQSFHTGTGVWGFDLQNFKTNYYILLPPPHILQSFHSLVEPLFQKIILNQKQIMTIRRIRDTLLPLLVFGKLRVEEL
ncbi:MAG: restriction endonuclease subunit S [candidate division WOR-3 bacterium]